VAPSTTAAAEPRIAAPPARIQVGPASTTCVWVVPTVSELPVRHSAAEPTAAPSATAAEEHSTVPRLARMATSAPRRTFAARTRMPGFRRPPRRPSRHRRALGPSQRRPRCRPSERRRRHHWRHGRLPSRHPADSPAPSNECPSGSVRRSARSLALGLKLGARTIFVPHGAFASSIAGCRVTHEDDSLVCGCRHNSRMRAARWTSCQQYQSNNDRGYRSCGDWWDGRGRKRWRHWCRGWGWNQHRGKHSHQRRQRRHGDRQRRRSFVGR